MNSAFDPQIIGSVVTALVSAAVSYLFIIRKTRAELKTQTKTALEAFREKTAAADLSDRLAFRAEQKAEMQELRQRIKSHEAERADMVQKLAAARANIIILEARVRALEPTA
jgi:predicted nuclease with TOPRIM domain